MHAFAANPVEITARNQLVLGKRAAGLSDRIVFLYPVFCFAIDGASMHLDFMHIIFGLTSRLSDHPL